MARPRRERVELPSDEQIKTGLRYIGSMQEVRKQAKGDGILSQFIEQDDLPLDSPGVFVTHSTDSRGHSHTLKLAVPQGWLAKIALVVNSEHLPMYRSNSDFVRDAIWHRMHDFDDVLPTDPYVDELMAAETTHLASVRRREKIDRNNQMVAQLRSDIAETRAYEGFAEYLEEMRERAERFSEPWRGQMLKIIDDA